MSRDHFHGDAQRAAPIFDEQSLGPWRGRVRVIPVRLAAGTEFEILAEWTGPPQTGFPPDPRPGDRSDVMMVAKHDLATELARRAVDELRAAGTVAGLGGETATFDLRRIHRALIERDGSPYADPALGAGRPAA